MAAGDEFQLENRYRSQDGQYRWFLGRACPVRDSEGRISRWFGTCTEIEEFKRLETERHKFVSLAENSTDFIGMWSQGGDLIYINAAGLRLVGLPDEDQARQLSVDEFLFPEDRVFVTEQFLPSVHVKGHGEMEVRLRDFRTGNGLWVTFHAFPLTDPRGKHIGLVTVSRDVTQRRQMEDHLRHLAADLSDADRRKDEVLATLAHELRNPLAPIRNGLQVIRLADGSRDSAHRVLPMMERQLGQLVRLVDDLLDVSRISRGKLELRRERVDLATVINNAVDTSRPLIDASGHRLTVDLPSRPIHVNADVVRLGQVFANLLNNAAKYSSPNGQIQITVRSDEKDVAVSVRDTGIGIPPHMLQKVFNLFTQVDPALDRSQGGLGIGLTLVKRLVEMHDGGIVAHSDGPGLGSTFTVTLPIDRSATISEVAGRGHDAEVRPDKLRILVADDNEDAAQSLAMMLQLLGHEVRTAGDGQQALDVAAQYRADLIFLDIGMPKLNGYEVCRRLKIQDELAGATVVALTGWGQDEDKSKALAAGFDHHYVKPIDPADLGTLLQRLTDR